MKRKHRSEASASAAPGPISSASLERIRMLWPARFMARNPEVIAEAEALWSQAVLGHPPSSQEHIALVEEERTSLPVMWASFFRPMRDGRTGTDLALPWFRIHAPELRPGIVRIAQARGVYAECLHLDASRSKMVLRDLLSGEIYHLSDVDKKLVPRIRRWLRFYGVLVDLGDGTWNYISAFSGVPEIAALPDTPGHAGPTPEEFLALAHGALAQAGVDPAELDSAAAPHAGLRRYCGIVFAAMGRSLRDRPAPEPARLYVVNSDGERIESQGAKLAISRLAAERLASALPEAADFVQTGDEHWCWISRQHTQTYPEGENLGDLDGIGCRIAVSVNSPQRFARLVDRLTELCGERPCVQSVTVRRPWERSEGVVPAPTEGVRTVTLATGAPRFDMDVDTARRNARPLLLESVRHKLSQEIPALRGVPRDLVHTSEGRAAVEKWLALTEARGLPGREGEDSEFVDLDPLRVELGLRTVADQIARGLGSRASMRGV